MSISASRTLGSTTQPEPITGTQCGIENPGGDEREGDLLVTDDDCVAGVVSALVAHDEVGRLGEVVGDPTLALVTPLRPENDVGRHAQKR